MKTSDSDPSVSCILKLQEIIKEPFHFAHIKINEEEDENEKEEEEEEQEEEKKILNLVNNYLPYLLRQLLRKK